ncbi:MAG TPA: hypothetical protein VMJ13_00610, partial [Candidatus Acidoferrum sp.]|nr:hypothetical protein [Candidatus Acidoferrum sp.]
MEFFRGVNIDWMGKAKYFVALSLTLLAIGAISIIRQGGLRYGIDFRGGTLVYVRFAGTPPLDQLRKSLSDAGLTNSTLQQISGELGNAGASHDVVIGLEQKSQDETQSLDAGKQAILGVLQKMYGQQDTKPDFNSETPSALASFLTQKDPLSLGTTAGDRYTKLAQALADARDKDHGGIVTNFDDLKNVSGVNPATVS